MRIVFVMDPISTVIVDEDTSFALMLAAQARGHEVFHALVSDVGMRDGSPIAKVRKAQMKRDPAQPVTLGPSELVALGDVDAVFVRKDPPFDTDYLWLTLALEPLRGTTLVVNDPRGLRDANEKLYACHFPEWMPPTLVSSDAGAIKAFVKEVGGRAVIKPIDGHGGAAVFGLREGDSNTNALIESSTLTGRRLAMTQAFIPDVTVGDKRILLLAGEPLGAILRVPQDGDLRSNIHVGGSVVKTDITPKERELCEAVAPRLAADGLYFVGLDVIGERLTEVNVTSPTGIQQMERFMERDLSAKVIEWTEREVSN